LQKLLSDIKEGKVQTVVVYKIDRLTRSLMDFSKLVEIFDEHGVTFVSITQSFNTTTSMGRLTLNVLLSFAQFEREVSAERIRDKILASKKKGMWMGGNPPIGYEAIDKKLIVNKAHAKTAKMIFERYLALGCVANLKKELDVNGTVSNQRISKRGNITGGRHYSRGALYSILQNPIYIGKIRHKDKSYDGQHEAIIQLELWDAVQNKLTLQAAKQRGHKKSTDQNLLKGLLFDCEGTPYSPDFTNKNGKRYRYYISQNLIQYRDHPKGTMARLPAHEIEKFVISTIDKNIIKILNLETIDDHSIIEHINKQKIDTEKIIKSCINKITIHQEELTIDINTKELHKALQDQFSLAIPIRFNTPSHETSAPFTTRKSYKGAVILNPKDTDNDPLDLPPHELRNLVKGTIWREEHFGGLSLLDIATRDKFSKQHVHQMIMKSMEIGATCQ